MKLALTTLSQCGCCNECRGMNWWLRRAIQPQQVPAAAIGCLQHGHGRVSRERERGFSHHHSPPPHTAFPMRTVCDCDSGTPFRPQTKKR